MVTVGDERGLDRKVHFQENRSDIRAGLQAVVSAEFPRVPVLTYGELPADVLVQPIARLTA